MSDATSNTIAAPVYFSAFLGLDPSNEVVVYMPFEGLLEYQGTRAALEAEGTIPAGTDWPEGFADLHWEDGRLHYRLRRERPEGHKGPRRQFLDVDWWSFRIDPLAAESFETRKVKRKAKELADAIHRATAQGQAEWHAQCDRYFAAKKDAMFQTFKAACGIFERKRGRHSNNRG